MKKLLLLLILCSSLTWCRAQCPSKLSVEISKIVPLTCYGDSNAIIDATPLNGISPYTYSWTGIVLPIPPGGSAISPSTPEDSIVSAQPAGTYTVTVKDSCGNTASVTAIITQPTVVTAPAIDAVHGTDSVEFTISKPDSTLSYSWSATDMYGHTYTGTAVNDTINLIYYLRGATVTITATNNITECTASTVISIIHPIISDYIAPANLPYARWSKRGMFLANANLYITDTATHLGQDSIVNFCKRNEITYVLLQNLEDFVFGAYTHYLDTTRARLLANFIAMLKDSAKVEEVGVECYDAANDSTAWNAGYFDIHFIGSSINNYNWNFNTDSKVDVVSMDDEFMWYSPDTNQCLQRFHNTHMPILRELYQAAHECPTNFLKVEDYLEEPMNPGNTNFHLYDPVEIMEKDSIALYADRIQNSCYTKYDSVLYNEADFILTYPGFGSDTVIGIDGNHKTIELWPAFDPANAISDSCTYCIDPINGDDFLGDPMCHLYKTPDYMEEIYYDSLAYSEKIKKFTDEGSSYTQFPMGSDTNFTIGGCFWFQYYCLRHVLSFDTGAASALKFYVSLGANKQWFYPSVMPPRPITLIAKARGGRPPFHYIWYDDSDRSVLRSSSSDTLSSDTLVVHFLYPKKISVLAIDADTLAATDYVMIYQMCNEGPLEGPVKPTKNLGNSETDITSLPIRLYPNPNNGSFTLEYILPEGEEGSLVLFNELGTQIGNYMLATDNNKMNIANSNLSNGVYIYQLWINNQSRQRGKIIVIK